MIIHRKSRESVRSQNFNGGLQQKEVISASSALISCIIIGMSRDKLASDFISRVRTRHAHCKSQFNFPIVVYCFCLSRFIFSDVRAVFSCSWKLHPWGQVRRHPVTRFSLAPRHQCPITNACSVFATWSWSWGRNGAARRVLCAFIKNLSSNTRDARRSFE